jgi:quinol-cytochrome oxidoreductase complex cytochrome b subunit
MKLDFYRKWLVAIWFAGFSIPFVLILFQFGGGKYGGKFIEVLGWLTSLTLPTILMMIGIIVANPIAAIIEVEKPEEEKTEKEKKAEKKALAKAAHEKFVFRFAVGISLAYLIIISLVFFFEPFSKYTPQELMRNSKIFLAVPDSLISLLIGYFFGKQ